MTSSKILSFEYEKKIYAFLLHFTHLSVSLQRFKCSYHMKRLLILTTLFVLCLCMTAQTPSIIDRPKVGLVLGGGGTKGAAELGALKVIEELNIPIDYIAGTSIGAILGGLYATGYRAEQLDSLFRSGLWMTDNVLELLERLTETDEWIDFDELPIPFRCVAVDFDTQEEVVFRNGHLATAMRASMAITVRRRDRRNGCWWCRSTGTTSSISWATSTARPSQPTTTPPSSSLPISQAPTTSSTSGP